MRHLIRTLAAGTAIFLLSGAASSAVIGTSTRYGLVDGREATRTLRINAIGIVEDIGITVEFAKCDDPPIGPEGTRCIGRGTPYENEFTLALIAPSGRRVDLVQAYSTYGVGRAGAGAGRVRVGFDDEAAQQAGPRVAAGTFRPAQALSLFDGMDMYGSWTLYLQDFFPSDPLEFFSARLAITPDANGAILLPEPATLGMFGLGLAGFGALRRRVSAPPSATRSA